MNSFVVPREVCCPSSRSWVGVPLTHSRARALGLYNNVAIFAALACARSQGEFLIELLCCSLAVCLHTPESRGVPKSNSFVVPCVARGQGEFFNELLCCSLASCAVLRLGVGWAFRSLIPGRGLLGLYKFVQNACDSNGHRTRTESRGVR
jgi:hypothetical protein